MKKKILFVGRFAPPMHGAAKMNELSFNVLNKNKNFEIKKIKLNGYSELSGMGKFSFNKVKSYLQLLKIFKKQLKEFNPEILYIEMAPRAPAFIKDSIFINIAKRQNKKIIIHFHAKGAKYSTKNALLRMYYKKVFNNTKIILLSKLLFKDIKNVTKLKQVKILPNGIQNEITDEEFNKIILNRRKNKKPILLFLSNMIETKGPIDVLNICNQLNKEKIDFECNFVGKFQDANFKKKFEKQLKDFELENKCKYLGAKYGEDKRKILEKTNFLIFPTIDDCFPLVILESFMFGIPVFSYNTGAIPEIISKNYLGLVSKKGDWELLFNKLKKEINKKSNTKKIRKYFKTYFNIENYSKNLKKIFE